MPEYVGLVQYISYFMAFVNEIMAYLFDFSSGIGFSFSQNKPWEGGPDGQFYLVSANLPDLTQKGADIVAAIMTMVHNGLVALAQLSTLLPANALPAPTIT